MSQFLGWIFPFILAFGFVDPIPLYRVIREVEDYQNIEAAYTNYTANEVCFSEMHVYQRGDVVPNAGPCEECRCEPPSIVCQMTKCPVNSNGCRTIQRPNHCCPDYNCDCEYGDRIYNDGEKIDTPGECQVCYCKGGEVMCTTIACYTRADCEPTYVPGQCCPTYQNCPVRDPNGSNGEEKAVPKREMQPWLLTKTESHTAPHIALTDASNKDLSTFPTTQVEAIVSENIATSHRESEATSAKPLNALDEVVFTRVDKNSSSPKASQEQILEAKTADQLNIHEHTKATETPETPQTTTTLDDSTITESIPEDVTEKLGKIQNGFGIIQTNNDASANPTEQFESKQAKIVEDISLPTTTTPFDETTSTTIQTLAYDKTSNSETATTENNLESSTSRIDILSEDISQDLSNKYIQSKENSENNKNYIPAEGAKHNFDVLTTSPTLEETTLTPTTEKFESTYTENFPSTKIHLQEIFKQSTENVGKFIISENTLDEPSNNLVAGKKVFKEEFPPLVVTNSIEYLTTPPSPASQYSDSLISKNILKGNLQDYETTQFIEMLTSGLTTETVTESEDKLVTLQPNTLKLKDNESVKQIDEKEQESHKERLEIESASSSKVDNVMKNNTNAYDNDQSKSKEDVEPSESHPLEIEIISHDEDEDSTQRIMVTSSASEEDGEPVVIDILHEDRSDENTDAIENVPPILELNSHVPFLQLGEDSSEETTETTETEDLANPSTSENQLKPERLLHASPNPTLANSIDNKKEYEILDNPFTTGDSLTREDEMSSTPIIPLTPGDLKALAEFMIKEKIKPADEKNNSMYRPNQWLEGNLTSEEKIASIMSAASVRVGLMNRTGSEKSIVPLETLRNKTNVSGLSEKMTRKAHGTDNISAAEIESTTKGSHDPKEDTSKTKESLTTTNVSNIDSPETESLAKVSLKSVEDGDLSIQTSSERCNGTSSEIEKDGSHSQKHHASITSSAPQLITPTVNNQTADTSLKRLEDSVKKLRRNV